MAIAMMERNRLKDAALDVVESVKDYVEIVVDIVQTIFYYVVVASDLLTIGE